MALFWSLEADRYQFIIEILCILFLSLVGWLWWIKTQARTRHRNIRRIIYGAVNFCDNIDYDFIPRLNLIRPAQQHRHQRCKLETEPHQSSKVTQKKKIKKRLKKKQVKRHIKPLFDGPSTAQTDNTTGDPKPKPPEPCEKELRASKWREIDKGSKQSFKPRAKIESERVYTEMLLKHDIKLACEICIRTNDHDCRRNKMLISSRESGRGWTEVHRLPENYEPCTKLCDRGEKCERKSRCKYPHSDEECAFWRILLENRWSMEALIEDIINTDLKLKHTVSHVTDGVNVLVVCKRCFKEKSFEKFLKVKKKRFCGNHHPWHCNQTLAVELTGEQNDNKKYIEVTKTLKCLSLDVTDDIQNDITGLQLLLRDGYSLDHIKSACHQFKQRKRVGVKMGNSKNKRTNYFKAKEDNEEFDDNFGDVVHEVNVDSDEVENSFRREAINNNIKDNIYYDLIAHEDLDNLLNKDPRKYKLCTIELDGTQKATCTVIGSGLKIEIRGRQNCGPTANGDLVVVEIRKAEKSNAEWEKKEGTKDEEELQVTRGTVVGIKAQNCNRKNYNFVCTVDEYFSHLMMPVCGTIPKIHCRKDSTKPKPNKVYVYTQNGENYDRQVKINRKNIHDKLFVVKYEEWGITHIYPRGYVVKVIKPGFDLLNGQRVLNLMYQVPPLYSDRINQDLSAKYSRGIPQSMLKRRQDFTKLNVISIDPPACKDIDDALSVKLIQGDDSSEEMYEVGIHISDVTAFLKKDDDIDIKASTRKTSFYPQHGHPRHMLPDKLRNLCSLCKNERRLTISLFVEIDKFGKLSSEPKFCRGVIMNHAQLTYTEAEAKLLHDSNSNDDDVASDIKILHMLAKGLREERIGRQCFFKETQISYDKNHEMAEESHMLVEEFMILANSLVATHLVENLPKQTMLVRSQSAPGDDGLSSWVKKHNVAIQCGFLFQDIPSEMGISSESRETLEHAEQPLNILCSSYDILSNPEEQDIKKLEDVIAMEKMHPTLAIGYSGWLSIQNKATVHKHEDDVTSRHFSLKKIHYTWFTSPIRRYMDIIIHRLLVHVMDKHKALAYNAKEIEAFSREFNNAMRRGKKHSRASSALQMASSLYNAPAIVPAFVSAFDDDSVTLEFPYLPQINNRNRTVYYGLLGVSEKPDIRGHYCTLTWHKRLYSTLLKGEYARSQSLVSSGMITKLNHKKHTKEIRKQNWLEVQNHLIHRNWLELPAAIERMIDASVPLNFQDGLVDDVTSEMKLSSPIIKHRAKFSMRFQPGQTVPVQLGTSATNGLLVTSVNLISLSETINICTEHVSDPVKCFADIATRDSKNMHVYRDVGEYRDIWLPILEMESATNAVMDGDPITVHNVPIKIEKLNDGYTGRIWLHTDFCNHRHINFIADKKESEEESQDYFCLRFPFKKKLASLPQMSGSFLNKHFPHGNMWIAHAQTTRSYKNKKDNTTTVDFVVTAHNAPLHDQVKLGELRSCTVEYISRTLSDRVSGITSTVLRRRSKLRDMARVDYHGDACRTKYYGGSALANRRMKEAVEKLDGAKDLSKEIILGKHEALQRVISDDVPIIVDFKVKQSTHPLPRNNSTQKRAIEHALNHTFTIVQGPPGTGKTLTGVKLVYWFNEMNKMKSATSPRRQVMYCGPSNYAVDVATTQLKSRLAEKCPKIVRVYSDMLENQTFPIPRDYGFSDVHRKKKQDIQEDIALHCLIRKRTNQYSSQLLRYDGKFANTPAADISDEEIEKYQRLVKDASIEELKKYDVILCTCSVSASPRVKRGTNINQLIIDESGMCMEPETIIPLVATSPAQVVLIGDHKQLRPIIKNQTAKDLGLERSLFERYVDNSDILIMLDEQYRMHREICAFPSLHFYGNKLKTVRSAYWDGQQMDIWPNPKIPVMFCHVNGEEKSLAVATEDGNEQSKSNEAECFHVKRIFDILIKWLNVRCQQICVLSQYKAQCKKIEKDLQDAGYDKVNVQTVVASQGAEWDYVILSTVRSMPKYEIEKRPSIGWLKRNLGFIVDRNQMNVAITRARRGLIIIGNRDVLACDNDSKTGFWGKLLKFYKDKECFIEASFSKT